MIVTTVGEQQIAELARTLNDQVKLALMPCASDRRCLLKAGLGKWHTAPGHRFPSIRPNDLGYRVRQHLLQDTRS